MRTDQRRRFHMLYDQNRFLGLLGGRRNPGQERTGLSDSGGAISVGEQAVVADFHEAQRQDVKAEAAQKLRQRESHRPDLALVGIVLVAEGDRPVLTVQSLQATVGDGDSMGVTAQIRQDGLRAGKGPFGVDDPIVATETPPPARKGSRGGQTRLRTVEAA